MHHCRPGCAGEFDRAQRTVRALERFGYGQGEFEEADFTTVPNFLSFSINSGWVDLMTSVLGVSFDEATTGSLRLTFVDVPVHYMGLAALCATKKATARPQDLRDLDNLPLA